MPQYSTSTVTVATASCLTGTPVPCSFSIELLSAAARLWAAAAAASRGLRRLSPKPALQGRQQSLHCPPAGSCLELKQIPAPTLLWQQKTAHLLLAEHSRAQLSTMHWRTGQTREEAKYAAHAQLAAAAREAVPPRLDIFQVLSGRRRDREGVGKG